MYKNCLLVVIRSLLVVLVATAGWLTTGCGAARGVASVPTPVPVTSHDAKDDPQIDKTDLEDARARWNSRKISSYQMAVRLKNTGYTLPAEQVLIDVKNRKEVTIKAVSDSRPVANYEKFSTIEKIFEVISAQLNSATEVRGIFNSVDGYPERLYVRNPDGLIMAYEVYIDTFKAIEAE